MDEKKKRKYHDDRIKQKVIEYYGIAGGCCFPGCEVDEIDQLTIDHIHGRTVRDMHVKTGLDFYRWLIANDFPRSYQTLCWNHNYQKACWVRKGARPGRFNYKWSRYK